VDCWALHHPPLDFHGASGRERRPWCCQRAPLSRTGADGPQAEEYSMAADAHCIAPVPCDEKGYFVFLDKALKKKNGLSGCNKKSRQILYLGFLFDQS
jgi:hypothetical protein